MGPTVSLSHKGRFPVSNVCLYALTHRTARQDQAPKLTCGSARKILILQFLLKRVSCVELSKNNGFRTWVRLCLVHTLTHLFLIFFFLRIEKIVKIFLI